MNAIATPRKARAAVKADASDIKQVVPDATAKWEHVASALWTAGHTDEDHPPGATGESDRLLVIASDLASRAAEERADGDKAHSIAFDIAALINAARLVPGDLEGETRTDRIASAGRVLLTFTEAQDVGEILFTDVPRPCRGQATSANADTSADLAYYRLGEAEVVIRVAAEADTNITTGGALWAAARIADLAKDCIPLGGANRSGLSAAGALLSQAQAVLELVTKDNEDVLADAGLTLLHAAQEHISAAEGEVPHV